jgi:hypothetical protein
MHLHEDVPENRPLGCLITWKLGKIFIAQILKFVLVVRICEQGEETSNEVSSPYEKIS